MSNVIANSVNMRLCRMCNKLNVSAVCRNTLRRHFNDLRVLSVVHDELGDPNKVLKFQEETLKGRQLDNDEILVKLIMAPVNPSDINMIEGSYHIRPKLPAVVGNEGVGKIVEVGDGVKAFKPGDWAIPDQAAFGTWRTHAIVNQNILRKVANDIPPLSAATIMVNPCTAYRMLKDFVDLQPGDVVMQNSANSAVGQSVIQIAKAWNIRTVNIVRNRDNLNEIVDYLKSLGADHVVTEEYSRTPDMRELMKSLGQSPKLAFNGVGGKIATELIRHLAQKGTMVTYGGMSRQPVVVPTGAFIFKELKAVGYWNALWNIENSTNPEREKMLEDLCDMIRTCKLKPPQSEIYPLEKYADVVESAMSGFQGKKKILSMLDD